MTDKKTKKINKLESQELQKIKGQAEEYLHCWQRAVADYQNLKKQVEKNQAEFVKYANTTLIIELLPILNNFKTAFNCIPDKDKENDWLKGIAHIKKQFEEAMKSLGIEEIKTKGEKFNPELHEAVDKAKSEQEEDMIIKEVQAGYKLNGRVIIPAKVIVSS